jgi:hypothetical protein
VRCDRAFRCGAAVCVGRVPIACYVRGGPAQKAAEPGGTRSRRARVAWVCPAAPADRAALLAALCEAQRRVAIALEFKLRRVTPIILSTHSLPRASYRGTIATLGTLKLSRRSSGLAGAPASAELPTSQRILDVRGNALHAAVGVAAASLPGELHLQGNRVSGTVGMTCATGAACGAVACLFGGTCAGGTTQRTCA